MTSPPETFYSNKHYDFFATGAGLIYFDKKNNKWAKAFPTQTQIYQSKINIYFKIGGKHYKLVQKQNN